MKKAIEYLISLGLEVDESGNILSKLPEGQRGITLVNMLEDNTMEDDHCFTIINNKIEEIEA